MNRKLINCCKCSELSEHSIFIREGDLPQGISDPKIPDKSRIRVIGFCGKHWLALKDFIELKPSNVS